MERKPVQSSNLREVGYSAADNVLEVQFHGRGCKGAPCSCAGGNVWRYAGVTAEQHRNLISSQSPGAWFVRQIRDKRDADGKLIHPGLKL